MAVGRGTETDEGIGQETAATTSPTEVDEIETGADAMTSTKTVVARNEWSGTEGATRRQTATRPGLSR